MVYGFEKRYCCECRFRKTTYDKRQTKRLSKPSDDKRSVSMDLNKYQKLIEEIYFEKDSKRGLDKTFNWFVEEIGEFSRAIRKKDKKRIREEFADCLAWLLSVGSILGIDAEEAMTKYREACPKCGSCPCRCGE
jgi:NTP pyrophosphatase (non-canonical NTP hydrolase)